MRKGAAQPNQESQELTDSAALFQVALSKLARAYVYAADVNCDAWQFAVEVDRLFAIGITTSTLRWSVTKGFAAHAVEVTRPNDTSRKFRSGRSLAFTKKTCFVITDAGLSLVKTGFDEAQSGQFPLSDISVRNENAFPRWDCNERTLYLGRQIVKQYRVPSPNQEALLSAFQEEGWPRFIHDPLIPVADLDPKQRLRDTTRCLNANQKHRLIRFRGDGTGERVCWELVNGQWK
jgi:hypothetical protein